LVLPTHACSHSAPDRPARPRDQVRWPGTVEAGSVSDYAWAFWDVLPTLAALIGFEAPANIDGESFAPVLLGNKTQPPKEYLVWTWVGTGEGPTATATGADGGSLVLVQDSRGRAAYMDANGNILPIPSDNDNGSGNLQLAGYALRSGDWKIVVPHCSASLVPSEKDETLVYHLPTDPFEAHNLNATDEGKQQQAALFALAKKHNITCHCFQC
jgi:arylsulfatase A-like enzyme